MFYKPSSLASWVFLLLVIIQALAVLALEGYVFVRFQDNVKDNTWKKKTPNAAYARAIPTYFTLFIFGHVFEILLAYDALRLKNTIQVIGICFFNLAMLVYSILQMEQIKKADRKLNEDGDLINGPIWQTVRPFLIAIPGIIGAVSVMLCAATWKLYDEFAWTIYKHISADLRMKRRYLYFQFYITLLKFDFFFFLGFTIQLIVIVIKSGNNKSFRNSDTEFYMTIAVIPLTIAVLLAAAWITRREYKYAMLAIIVLYFGALAYFIFKLVRMYQKDRAQPYIPARPSLTTFACIGIVLAILTIANAVMCLLNFNKGLKPYVARRKLESAEDKLAMSDMDPHNLSAHHTPPTRMTID